MNLDPEIDRRIRSTSKWYWNKHFRQNSTLQYEDVLQHCRLRILEKPVTDLNHVSQRVCWEISNQFMGRNNQKYHFSFEFEDTVSYDDLRGISDQQREYLYENMWVVGHPGSYETLRRYIEGETTKSNSLSSTMLRRGREYLAQAFPSADHLLSNRPAAWFPKWGKYSLRVFRAKKLTEKEKEYVSQITAEQSAFLARQL